MSWLQKLLFSQLPRSLVLELLIGGEQSNPLAAIQPFIHLPQKRRKKPTKQTKTLYRRNEWDQTWEQHLTLPILARIQYIFNFCPQGFHRMAAYKTHPILLSLCLSWEKMDSATDQVLSVCPSYGVTGCPAVRHWRLNASSKGEEGRFFWSCHQKPLQRTLQTNPSAERWWLEASTLFVHERKVFRACLKGGKKSAIWCWIRTWV